MIKRIKLNELPKIVTEEVFNTLVEMALESPKTTFDWSEISNYLSENNYPLLRKIFDKVNEHQKAIEQAKEDAKSDEQKSLEVEHSRKADEEIKKFFDENGYYPFQGNMGQPVTLEDFKLRYGKYPPGYNKNGKKN